MKLTTLTQKTINESKINLSRLNSIEVLVEELQSMAGRDGSGLSERQEHLIAVADEALDKAVNDAEPVEDLT